METGFGGTRGGERGVNVSTFDGPTVESPGSKRRSKGLAVIHQSCSSALGVAKSGIGNEIPALEVICYFHLERSLGGGVGGDRPLQLNLGRIGGRVVAN